MTPLVDSVILQSMVGDENFSHDAAGLQVVINYWQTKPALFGSKLDDLIRQGIPHVTAFVPWQAIESDISHSLVKFLAAASERKLTVSLILTPEVGVHFRSMGLPKDLLSKPDNLARDARGQLIMMTCPPQAVALPSLLASDVVKRYQNYLLRLDSLLADATKIYPKLLQHVDAVITGSFWKYYRTTCGSRGDFSSQACLAFRTRVDSHFNQAEFGGDIPQSTQRWKGRALEGSNRSWFLHDAESAFRQKTETFIGRRASGLRVRHIDLFTPELIPNQMFALTAALLFRKRAPFKSLEREIEAVSHFEKPSIRLTDLASFRLMRDHERQFLVIKSLLLTAPKGGSLLIDEAEWYRFSVGFRARVESLSRQIQGGAGLSPMPNAYAEEPSANSDRMTRTPQPSRLVPAMTSSPRAAYLVADVCGEPETIWLEIEESLRSTAIKTSDPTIADRIAGISLLVVSPQYVIDDATLDHLVRAARCGVVVALPRHPLYSDRARRTLESILSLDQSRDVMDVHFGVSYKMKQIGEGRLIVYEVPPQETGAVSAFVDSIAGISDARPFFKVADPRIKLIGLNRTDPESGSGDVGLFILNHSPHAVGAEVFFDGEVSLADLNARAIEAHRGETQQSSRSMKLSKKFKLEVPPYGILPVAVEGAGQEALERKQAALLSEVTRRNVFDSAANELPGLEIWN